MGAVDFISRFSSRVSRASGWSRVGYAFAAGLFSVLAMAPFHVSPVLFLTLPVLVWLLDGTGGEGQNSQKAAVRAGIDGWWFGFGYFIAGLFWIGEAFLVEADKYAVFIPLAVTLLPAGLAFFFAGATAAARAFWPSNVARILVLAISLAIAEWLRGHVFTGFPWNTLGYALTQPLELMQVASLMGTYSLTLWTVLIGAAPLAVAADHVLRPQSQLSPAFGIYIAAVPLVAFLAFGTWRLAYEDTSNVAGVTLRLVQPSIAQAEKWKPENQGPIFRAHLDLSLHNAEGVRDGLAGITHVIWPEAAMPFLPLEHPEAIRAIGEAIPAGSQLLSGGLRLAQDQASSERQLYNSLIVFGDAGQTLAVYDKNHLVPFGEYLPFASVLRLIGFRGLVEMRGRFENGAWPRTLMNVAGLPPVGALICYEAIFPGDVVQTAHRPGLLLSVTNDGWFGNTTGPRQHFHQARVRAVEEGLPLIRVANNGISAVITPSGRVTAMLALDERGVIDAHLPTNWQPTSYSRLGDWILMLQICCYAFATVIIARRIIRV